MESTPQQTAEEKAVVAVLAAVLERLVERNAQSSTSNFSNGSDTEVTKFHALKAPGISIKQYLERIHKYASCSTECFILALIYIDRLIQHTNFILTELNVHRVVITAILLAAKFFDDAYYNNAYYAKVGGVVVAEMNGLEVEFLFRINFSLHVKPEVFMKYQAELASHAVGAGLEQPAMKLPEVFHAVDTTATTSTNATAAMATEEIVAQQQPPQEMKFTTGSNMEVSHKVSPQTPCSESSTTQLPHEMQFHVKGYNSIHTVDTSTSQGQQQQQLHQQPQPAAINNYHFVAPSPEESNCRGTEAYIYPKLHEEQQRRQQADVNENFNKRQSSKQTYIVETNYDIPINSQQQYQDPIQEQSQQQQPLCYANNTKQQHPYQQVLPNINHNNNNIQKVIPSKNNNQYQINSNNFQRNNLPTDVLFNTCCPYGRRLSPNASSPVLLDAVRGLYQ